MSIPFNGGGGLLITCILLGRRKHLKFGVALAARHFEETFFLKKKGHFLQIKRVLLCLLQTLEGTCPQCPTPAPTSTVF